MPEASDTAMLRDSVVGAIVQGAITRGKGDVLLQGVGAMKVIPLQLWLQQCDCAVKYSLSLVPPSQEMVPNAKTTSLLGAAHAFAMMRSAAVASHPTPEDLLKIFRV